MNLKKSFFVALTTIAAVVALSTATVGAATLGYTEEKNPSQPSTTPTPTPTPSTPVQTGDSSATAAVLATAGVVALGTAVAATKLKKASK